MPSERPCCLNIQVRRPQSWKTLTDQRPSLSIGTETLKLHFKYSRPGGSTLGLARANTHPVFSHVYSFRSHARCAEKWRDECRLILCKNVSNSHASFQRTDPGWVQCFSLKSTCFHTFKVKRKDTDIQPCIGNISLTYWDNKERSSSTLYRHTLVFHTCISLLSYANPPKPNDFVVFF